MRGRRLWIAGVLFVLAASGNVFGSGYSIYEQGAKAMANGGAFSARADDPSALFFNPAGILQLPGIQVNLGTTAVLLDGSKFISSTDGQEYRQLNSTEWPSSLYFTQKFSDDWAWGLAINSPFGLKTDWGPDFEGRYISRKADLSVVNVNPNLARRIGKSWSVAAGIDYATADIRELSRNIPFGGGALPDGFTKLTGNGSDFGWNVAGRWASETGWRWGGSYRSEMKPDIKGDVKFENIPGFVAALFPDGPASSTIFLPATFATGVGYLSKGKWEGEFDIVYTRWSVFKNLDIDIVNDPAGILDVHQVEDWKDTYSFRAGYILRLTDEHQIRLGLYYDGNPIPSDRVRPRLPDADRSSAQVGYGYASRNGFSVDFAYMALYFKERAVTGDPTSATNPVLSGVYKNFTNLVGITFGYRFGK